MCFLLLLSNLTLLENIQAPLMMTRSHYLRLHWLHREITPVTHSCRKPLSRYTCFRFLCQSALFLALRYDFASMFCSTTVACIKRHTRIGDTSVRKYFSAITSILSLVFQYTLLLVEFSWATFLQIRHYSKDTVPYMCSTKLSWQLNMYSIQHVIMYNEEKLRLLCLLTEL